MLKIAGTTPARADQPELLRPGEESASAQRQGGAEPPLPDDQTKNSW